MTEEMKKRFEEAARNYAETVVVIQSDLREEYIKESMHDFKTGASFGYKEAISHIKEYLETKRKDILAVGDEPRALRAEIAVLDEIINELFKED